MTFKFEATTKKENAINSKVFRLSERVPRVVDCTLNEVGNTHKVVHSWLPTYKSATVGKGSIIIKLKLTNTIHASIQ